jgi:phage protein D
MTETSVSQAAVYSARPTLRIDERESEKASALLIGMEMTEQEGGLSALALRLSNVASDPQGSAGYAFESENELRLGSTIAVSSGDETAPQEIFRGTVTGFEAEFPETSPPELVVLAEDLLQSARMTRRTLTFSDMSLNGLASSVAATLNLTPVISEYTDVLGTWVQLNESDLAFLRRILHRYDGDVQVVGNELHVSARKDVRRGDLELEMFGQLRSVKFIADLTNQVSDVTVSGWDAIAGRRITASSQGANLGPGNGRRGSQILAKTIGERTEHVGHISVTTEEEARMLADTVYDQRARRFVCAHGLAEGNPALRVGTNVRLTGISPRFQNTYYVVAVCHRFDVLKGYETHFKAECYSLGNTR